MNRNSIRCAISLQGGAALMGHLVYIINKDLIFYYILITSYSRCTHHLWILLIRTEEVNEPEIFFSPVARSHCSWSVLQKKCWITPVQLTLPLNLWESMVCRAGSKQFVSLVIVFWRKPYKSQIVQRCINNFVCMIEEFKFFFEVRRWSSWRIRMHFSSQCNGSLHSMMKKSSWVAFLKNMLSTSFYTFNFEQD